MCCEGKQGCGCDHQSHSRAHCCCCHGSAHFGPEFWTRDEKINWLEEKLAELRDEMKAYEERIEALKAE
jgi:hypothetical protein